MNNVFLIQAIGAVGYATLAFSYFKKEKKQILFIQIVSYIFFTVHYYFLNGITGAICNLVGLIAFVVIFLFDKYSLKHKVPIAVFFVAVLLGINIMTFQNVWSIFPMIASTVVIMSFVKEKDSENYIRGIGVIAAVCWLLYAIVYKSYVAIAFEVITLINVCIAFIKNLKRVEDKK